jgi:hypothetical protein
MDGECRRRKDALPSLNEAIDSLRLVRDGGDMNLPAMKGRGVGQHSQSVLKAIKELASWVERATPTTFDL